MYTGREFDSETGLQYYRARYYDSTLGRFIGEDPLPLQNLYSYVDGNPVNYVDPLGMAKRKLLPLPGGMMQARYGTYDKKRPMAPLKGGVSDFNMMPGPSCGGGGGFSPGGGGGGDDTGSGGSGGSGAGNGDGLLPGSPSFGDFVNTVLNGSLEYFRAFSAGYGPDRYNLLDTVNTSRPDIQNVVGLGGAAYSLTPLLVGNATSRGWKYGKEEYTEYSHAIPFRYLRDLNKWLEKWTGISTDKIYDRYYDRTYSIAGRKYFWNGDIVNQGLHWRIDPESWPRLGASWPDLIRLPLRTPTWLQGLGLGNSYRSARYGNQ